MAEARDAALVNLAQTGRRQRRTDRIVPGVDCRAAILQGDGLGRSAVGPETAKVQPRIDVEVLPPSSVIAAPAVSLISEYEDVIGPETSSPLFVLPES
jgi:hypothetical protein